MGLAAFNRMRREQAARQSVPSGEEVLAALSPETRATLQRVASALADSGITLDPEPLNLSEEERAALPPLEPVGESAGAPEQSEQSEQSDGETAPAADGAQEPDFLPADFPAREALEAAGILTLSEVRQVPDEALIALPRIGRATVEKIRSAQGE